MTATVPAVGDRLHTNVNGASAAVVTYVHDSLPDGTPVVDLTVFPAGEPPRPLQGVHVIEDPYAPRDANNDHNLTAWDPAAGGAEHIDGPDDPAKTPAKKATAAGK